MANHSRIHLTVLHTLAGAEELLQKTVQEVLGDEFVVTPRPELKVHWPRASCIWDVHLPNTSPNTPHQPDDYGFIVMFNSVPKHNSQEWEFRHPINQWERWAQSRVMNTLAQGYGAQIYSETGDSYEGPDPEVLAHSTFSEFICRNFERPLSDSNREYLQGVLDAWAPPKHRTLP